jgi:hypothetical protein
MPISPASDPSTWSGRFWTGAAIRLPRGSAENRCPTVFRPFFTVFDRFPDRQESKIIRRFKGPTVFGVAADRLKTVKTV